MHTIRALRSGTLVEVDDRTGRAEFLHCDWLVEVPTNDPEPCCREDMYRLEECGARVRMREGQTDPEENGFICEGGHERIPVEEYLAPYGQAWQEEQMERMQYQ